MSGFTFTAKRLTSLSNSKSPEPTSIQNTTTTTSRSSESFEHTQPQDEQQPQIQTRRQLVELTKNDYYKVTRLPGLPHIFSTNPESIQYTYTDSYTKHAVAISNDMVYIWKYDSNDTIPVTITLPIHVGQDDQLPKAVLVSPVPELQDPGVVIIDSNTGLIKYFETIYSAPIAGLLHSNRVLELNLKLKNERVELAQYIPKVGVFIATSSQRVVLLTLNDPSGKTCLNAIDVISPNRSLLGRLFSNSQFSSNGPVENCTVAIRPGQSLSHGVEQVVLQDSDGRLSIIEFNSVSGVSIPFQQNIKNLLFNHITAEDYYNLSSFKILDIQPLLKVPNHYIILTSIDSTLLLFSVKIEYSGVLVISANRIRNKVIAKDNDTPAGFKSLFVPPGYDTTVFILSNNILALTNATLTDNTTNTWEEYISFKPETKILGVGYEAKENAINIITRDSGILKVDVLPNVLKISDPNTLSPADSTSFIKSRIEQAISYDSTQGMKKLGRNETLIRDESDDDAMEDVADEDTETTNPLRFDIDVYENHFPQEDIESAITSVCLELLNNKSSCISSEYLSISNHLIKRCEMIKKLIYIVSNNFLTLLSNDFIEYIISISVKLNLSLQFYLSTEKFSNLRNQLEKSISTLNLKSGNDETNLIREYFLNHNESILDLLSSYFQQDYTMNEDLDSYSVIALNTFIEGFLNIELQDREILNGYTGSVAYLLLSKGICASVCSLLENFSIKNADQLDNTDQTTMLEIPSGLSLFLYYATSFSLIHFNGLDKNAYDLCLKFFNEYRENWISIFIVLRKQDSILQFAIEAQDYLSICEILESERGKIVASLESETYSNAIERVGLEARLEKAYQLYDQFFVSFGYPFAKVLYKFYIDLGELKLVLFGFTKYNEYANKFFEENRQYDYFSWIKTLMIDDYESTAQILLNSFKSDPNIPYDDKRVQLNLAKLSLVILKRESSTTEHQVIQINKMIEDIVSRVASIDLTSMIHSNLIDALTALQDSSIEKLIDSSNVHKLKGSPSSNDLLKYELSRLEEMKLIKIDEIVDILTLIKFEKFSKIETFYDCFKLVAMFTSSNTVDSKIMEIIIKSTWRRLFIFTEWDEIISILGDKTTTPQQLLLFLNNVPIFNCFKKLESSELLNLSSSNDGLIKLPNLDSLSKEICNISYDEWKFYKASDETSEFFNDDKAFKKYIDMVQREEAELKTLVQSKNISKWIKVIIESIN